MADSANHPSSPRQRPRGNRRNDVPTRESHNVGDNSARGAFPRGRSHRGQRGTRGRGRGSSDGIPATHAGLSLPGADPPPISPPDGNFGGRLTEAASQIQGDLNVEDGERLTKVNTAETEGEVCFICASTIEHISIAPCNHQTCHICALRLRALYKTKACAHCRSEAEFVIFTDDSNKRYQDFVNGDFVKVDENLGVKFENDGILEDTILLLRYNCPDKDCEVQCLSWPDLHRHVRSKHGKIMCDLCTRNKKVFTHEHELFSYGELRRHERFGDDNPGAIDQSGFKGHPECGFCRQRFYGDDELYSHCREKHERCHICDRRDVGRNPQYYLNYQELEKHFAEAHFVCLDAECQANKTNVFESEIDLKAHQLHEHPNGLSKDARRDARLVSLSGFDLRSPYQPERRVGTGAREHRGAGRGRDPNADPLPVSSAQPIGRAELAYQRQMAIQSSQSVSNRTFGGQLTQAAPPPTRQQPQSQSRQSLPMSSLDSLTLSDATSSSPQTPQDQARALRHNLVTDRASALCHASSAKLSQFRTQVSSYRSNTLTAPALVESFANDIFSEAPSADLGKLVRELADLYDNDAKRQGLLEAWNSWRSINDEGDYPQLPLPTASGSSSGSTLNIPSGRRVLRLKSSTAQSSRSAVSRQGSWGNALSPPASGSSASASASNSNPFPALANTSKKSKNESSTTAWGTSTTTSSSDKSRPTSTASNTLHNRLAIPRPPTTMGARANEEMFPSLPAAKKPDVLMAGLTRGTVRWDDRRSGTSTPTANPWSGSAAPTPAQAAMNGGAGASAVSDGFEPFTAGEAAGGKKKGKKGKGQLLYHFG